ncbi:hypothetical protein ACSMXN_12415 [Jatrophihabitans sp. DSM 45814]
MQEWIVAGAWAFAALFAAVLFAFVGYELSWKSRRLERDRDRLGSLLDDLRLLGRDLSALADRTKASAESLSGPAGTDHSTQSAS